MATNSSQRGNTASRIARYGQTITLRRFTGTARSKIERTCKAVVRPRPPVTDATGASVQQTSMQVILSPALLEAAGWTWDLRKGDRIEINGRSYEVESQQLFSPGGVDARIEAIAIG